MEDLSGYVAAKSDALRRLGCAPNTHLTLCDFSTCTPQSQAVVALFRASLDDPRSRSRRLAVVVGSALATLQAKRAATRPDAAFFPSIMAAEDWLFGGAGSDQEPVVEGTSMKR